MRAEFSAVSPANAVTLLRSYAVTLCISYPPIASIPTLFTPLLSSHGDVLREALAVEPGFATVDVAHIDEVFVGGIL